MSLYAAEIEVAGIRVRCKPKVKSWGGWPDEARGTLERWNRTGRLSFLYAGAVWGGYATGLQAMTCKCSECGAFFNSSGSTACWLRNGSKTSGRWVCDDCIVELARRA